MLEALLLLIANIILLVVDPGLWPLSLVSIILLLICIPGARALFSGPPYIPTPMERVRAMVKLANPKPGELVYDIGCGDGRLVFESTKKGAKGIGYELSVPTFLIAKVRSLWHPRSRISCKNLWVQDYRSADVLYCYLLRSVMPRFEREIWPQLKPGTRVVSHKFQMLSVKPKKELEGVYLYEKP